MSEPRGPSTTNGGAQPKILVIDIETAPALGWFWGLWKQNIAIGQIKEPSRVISFAARWHGQERVMFYSEFHHTHLVMIEKAWELIDQADIVVHYNGTSFDLPHLRRHFKKEKLGPPSPVLEIDLLKSVRQFNMLSNKLDYALHYFEIGAKVKHEGFPLWVGCMNGDAGAWRRMKKYNIGDVVETDNLYIDMIPWLNGAPHLGAVAGIQDSCPRCGSTDRQRRGPKTTGQLTYQQYRCNSCGSWHRDVKSISELRMTTRAVQ